MVTSLPKISIGMPIYNRPQTLRRALEEIVNQTYQNLEIIVSDNASSDKEVEEVLKEFIQRDNRIQYFCQPVNIGYVNNFQFVLDKASGEFFMWAADDDWRETNFVEELYKKLVADSSAIVAFCDFDIRDENGCPVSYYRNSCTALRSMTGNNSSFRQIRFFMLGEGRAIPHAVYGLFSMKTMQEFSWAEYAHQYGEYGVDTLIIFSLLGQGRLALVKHKLFGCTVNNQKYYGNEQERFLVKKIRAVGERISYLFSFIKIARGWAKIAIIILFPIKLTEVLFSMFINEPFNIIKQKFNLS